jgi:hypothetical protein
MKKTIRKTMIKIDLTNIDSIKMAEKKKAELENKGYTLSEKIIGFSTAKFVYIKK